MSSWQACRIASRLFGMSILAFGVQAWADVGPPVEIKMRLDIQPAVSGQEYAGIFEVRIFKSGTLARFQLEGEGWTILAADLPASPVAVEPGVLKIPFRAVPADANKPIGLSLTWNGRRVQKAYEIGPAYFGRAGRSYNSVCIARDTAEEPQRAARAGQADSASGASEPSGRPQLRFTGRIVYRRPCRDMRDPNNAPPDGDCDDPWDIPERIVGADLIHYEVWDSDPFGHVTIWSGYTDVNGYFDTGTVDCEDCDDEPDLVLFYETNSPVVDVTDNTVAEWTYSFESEEITDFTGTQYDFCWHAPENSALYPPLHIYNSVVRTHRFIITRSDLEPPKVQVEWPDDAEPTSWYEPGPVEIHMNPMHNWHEEIVSHEYGHHVMHSYGDPPESDYCNPGNYCDEDPTEEDCGHCIWCPENEQVAWNEGLPNWLADVVTRSYALDYVFDDGSDFCPLYTLDFESEGSNTECSGVQEPLVTEGFVAMLLRDIEDDMQDPLGLAQGPTDSLCLGAGCILETQAFTDPTTVLEFMNTFRARYPQWSGDLYPTARNVAVEYVADYGPDNTPPGAVAVCDSPTHPLGGWGALPCITIEWQSAPDEGWGARHYSLQWGQDPAGAEPDTTDEDDEITWSGCYLSTSGGPFNLGDWYVSIRAGDWSGNWSTTWSTFGPFTVGECNGNGILDVCEITCDLSTLGLPCNPGWNYCRIFWPETCGGVPDCNGNLIPDECDISSGFSEDCNLNAIPDECENMYHWAGTSGSWHAGVNWIEGTPPTTGSEVCIDVSESPTVTYSTGSLQIATLACSENLAIEGTTGSRALTVTEPSFVLGNLRVKNNDTVLQVDERLDISGLFEWTGSNVSNSAKLKGPGVTYANGGVQISDTVRLDGHRLVLDGNSTSISTTGRVDFTGPAVFEIRPGSTYEHRGSGYIVHGWFGDRFVNGGTLIKSVDPGSSDIYMFTENNGLIHVQAGTLKFYLYGSSTGDFLADPGTTLHFVDGGFVFYSGSSVVAHTVIFGGGGGGWSAIYGTWDVAGPTTVQGGQVTFADAADIVSYGSSFHVTGGTVNFNAPIGGPIQFTTLSVGPGGSGGTANFNSGDAVQATNLLIGPGSITGPGDITVSGLMTWNPAGSIVGPGTINANGGLLVNAGGSQKTLTNRTLNNAATATFLGELGLSGTAIFNNLPGGLMDIQFDSGASVINGGTLNNSGTLVKSAGTGTSWISSNVTNTGIAEIQTGTLQFYTYYGYFYRQTAGQTILNGGDLAMMGPAPVQIDGGLLTGAGTITGNVVHTAGTLAPGLSVGRIDIVGTYTQQAGAALEIELADTLPGAYDTVVCTGNVSLAGNLAVAFVSPFEPQHGDAFVVVTTSSGLSVTFSTVTVHNLPPTMVLEVDADYGLGIVTLRVIGGDCDMDGALDFDDFEIFAACMAGPEFGVAQDCSCADLDGDDDVDLADFAELQQAFTGP